MRLASNNQTCEDLGKVLVGGVCRERPGRSGEAIAFCGPSQAGGVEDPMGAPPTTQCEIVNPESALPEKQKCLGGAREFRFGRLVCAADNALRGPVPPKPRAPPVHASTGVTPAPTMGPTRCTLPANVQWEHGGETCNARGFDRLAIGQWVSKGNTVAGKNGGISLSCQTGNNWTSSGFSCSQSGSSLNCSATTTNPVGGFCLATATTPNIGIRRKARTAGI